MKPQGRDAAEVSIGRKDRDVSPESNSSDHDIGQRCGLPRPPQIVGESRGQQPGFVVRMQRCERFQLPYETVEVLFRFAAPWRISAKTISVIAASSISNERS